MTMKGGKRMDDDLTKSGSQMKTGDEQYVYTKVRFTHAENQQEWPLPEENSNSVALQMMSQLINMVHAEGYLFRITKDKICWRESDGTQCVVEFI